MADSNVMTVEEMIRLSFKDKDKNVVNFNLIGTILHLLARQLQVLKRKVEVKLDTPYNVNMIASNIMVTEVKIHASISYAKDESPINFAKKRSSVVRFQTRDKESQTLDKFSTKDISEKAERAWKFSEDVFSRPPNDADDMFLYFSPRFSEGRHLTSRSSPADSLVTTKSKLEDKCGEQDISVEMKQFEFIADNKPEEKQSQAKSLDTLLYKVDTNTRGKRHVTVAPADNITKHPKPQIIIKDITHTTDTETDERVRKIVILKKVRRRLKPKPLKALPREVSDSSEIADADKYRLSTEPYLGEDFVPIDLTKPNVEEEIDRRKSIFELGGSRFFPEDETDVKEGQSSNESYQLEGITVVDDNLYLHKGKTDKTGKGKKSKDNYDDLDTSKVGDHDKLFKRKGKDDYRDTSKAADDDNLRKGKQGRGEIDDLEKFKDGEKLGKGKKGRGIKDKLDRSKKGKRKDGDLDTSKESDEDELKIGQKERRKYDDLTTSIDGDEDDLRKGKRSADENGSLIASMDGDEKSLRSDKKRRGRDDDLQSIVDKDNDKKTKLRGKYSDLDGSKDGDDKVGLGYKGKVIHGDVDESQNSDEDKISIDKKSRGKYEFEDKLGKDKKSGGKYGDLGTEEDSEENVEGQRKKGRGDDDRDIDNEKLRNSKEGRHKHSDLDTSENDDEKQFGKSKKGGGIDGDLGKDKESEDDDEKLFGKSKKGGGIDDKLGEGKEKEDNDEKQFGKSKKGGGIDGDRDKDKESDEDDLGKAKKSSSKDGDLATIRDENADHLRLDKDLLGRDSKIDKDVMMYEPSKTGEGLPGSSADFTTDNYKIKCKKDVSSATVQKTSSEIETGQRSKFPFITREEFEKLQDEFLDVKETLHTSPPKDSQDQKLMDALSKATTSIDPMAALQFSASLETAEKKIDDLTNIFSSLAQQFPGSIDPNELAALMKSVENAKQYRLVDNKGIMAGSEQSRIHEIESGKKGAKYDRATDSKETLAVLETKSADIKDSVADTKQHTSKRSRGKSAARKKTGAALEERATDEKQHRDSKDTAADHRQTEAGLVEGAKDSKQDRSTESKDTVVTPEKDKTGHMASIAEEKQYRSTETKDIKADRTQIEIKLTKSVTDEKQYFSSDTKYTATNSQQLETDVMESVAHGKKYRSTDGKDTATAPQQLEQTDAIAHTQMSSRVEARRADEEEVEDVLHHVISVSKKTWSHVTTSIGGFPIKVHEEEESEYIRDSDYGSQMPIKRSRMSYRSSTLSKQEHVADSALEIPTEFVTYEELDLEMENLTKTIMNEWNTRKKHCLEQVEETKKQLKQYEQALKATSKLKDSLEDVNVLIANFAKGVNRIEKNVSTTMSGYMENLTQMQYNLENHVENMMEALASAQGDPVAVADFSKLLNFFLEKRQALHDSQMDASAEQNRLAGSLEALRALILAIKMDKYDRSDFAVSLANLISIFDLNSLIPYDTFEANWNAVDKKIIKAFSSFDAAEENWQEQITHTVQHLNCKATKLEIELLFNNIRMHCENLDKQAKALSAIVDHDQSEADSRHIIRDANCMSCRTLPPEYKRGTEYGSKRSKGEASKTATPRFTGKENALFMKGVTHIRPCYPGELIKHALDPRAKFCLHYCGGDAKPENLMKVQVQSQEPKCTCGDKMDKLKKPCMKCNTKRSGRMKNGQGRL